MALTAARTELNVILQGADETARMLQEARERMQQMEERLRALTAATRAQAGAAGGAAGATGDFSDRIIAAANAVDGYRDRVDGSIGKVQEYIGLFGDVGDIVNGAIDGYKFLRDAMSDADEEAERLKKSLEEQAKAAEETRKSIEELAQAQQASIVGLRSAGQGILQEQIKLAELQKDEDLAASLRKKLEHQTQLDRIAELKEQIALKKDEELKADQAIRDATRRIDQNERYVKEQMAEVEKLSLDVARKKIEFAEEYSLTIETGFITSVALLSDIEDSERKIKNIKEEIFAITHKSIEPEKERLETASQTFKALINQESALNSLLEIYGKVGEALKGSDVLQMDVLDESKQKPRGGGGRRKTKEEVAREEREKAYERFKIIRDLNEEEASIEETKQRALAKAALGDEVLASQKQMKERILRELGSLPTDATSKAFEPLRVELQKQLVEIDKVTAQHAEMGFWGLPDYFDADIVKKVLDSWDAEAQGIAKVDAALTQLGQTRAKAIEESEKMREAMFQAMPAEVVNNFTTGLEQLGQMQAPVFEAVQESLAGVAAQMAKFKEGQTSLASAIVGSASAIAGAVAKKVGGVKAEAGVRAAFEVAMGIATAFTNPAESAGHFAAATAFGLLAGGKVVSTDARASGGQKAPAKAAASTRESGMGGGGGSVTNVYNLQTGIVDGQSTAMAFRRAEMTARNTGMASAGGW